MENGAFKPLPESILSQERGDAGHELVDVLKTIDGSLCSSRSSTVQSSMTLPFLEDEKASDSLLEQVSSPLPHLDWALNTIPNQLIPYVDFRRLESDAETPSKLSLDALRQSDLPQSFVSTPGPTGGAGNNTYCRRRSLTISDIYDNGTLQRELKPAKHSNGTKRKTNSCRSSSTKRQKKITQTSKFCHICVRSEEQVTLVPCSNVVYSVCRKAVCQKCFEKHRMMNEWERAIQNRTLIQQFHEDTLKSLPESRWTCPHCQNKCPASAQCNIYAKTNRKRHLRLQRRKLERELHLQVKQDARKNMKANENIVYVLPNTCDLPQLPPPVSLVGEKNKGTTAELLQKAHVELNGDHNR